MFSGMDNPIDTTLASFLLIRSEPLRSTYPVVLDADQRTNKRLGYQAKQLTGLSLDKILSPPSLVLLQQQLSTEQSSQNSMEVELLTEQGELLPALLSIRPLPNSEPNCRDFGLLLHIIASGNDLPVMRRVIEQSANAMMITNRQGCIEYINPKFSELTGYSAGELLGQNPKMLQSGQMPKGFYQTLWQALRERGEWQGEMQNRHKDGHCYWVYESISAIKNSSGVITHFLSIEENINQRKSMESALLESEQRFRQMAELSGEWLWEQDAKGYYLYSSIAVQQILGLSQRQIIGKHYTELLTAQDQENQSDFSGNQHAFYALTNHYRHQDGHLVITESTGLPIVDGQGNLLKWRGVDRDITARVQYQNALIDSEKRTRLIIESSLNAIVIMDSYGLITDWNPRAETMFGWSADEAIGRRLDELIIPERFRSVHRSGLQRFLESGSGPMLNRQIEHIGLRRDGGEFPVEISVSPLRVGNAYIFSGFIHDISKRKAAERQIRQAQVNLAVAQNEIKIAQRIQASLLPAAAVKTTEFEIAGYCLPADKVGGDYYDYFFREEGLFDIVIADVSGHSIGPALFMVETRSVLRMQHPNSAKPAQTLADLNRFLFNDLDQANYFITLFYLQIDPARRQFHYACAGHPPPLLFNTETGQFTELDADGLIIGIKPEVSFEEKSLPLTKGDYILFYTDGLPETENTEQGFFGLQRVKTVLQGQAGQTPQAVIEALLKTLREFRQSETFDDDITVMVFRWLGI